MKTLILLVTLLLTSCGAIEGLNKNCGEDLRMGCNFIFGMRDDGQDEQLKQLTSKNDEQDAKIAALQNSINNMILSIDSLDDTSTNNINVINALQTIVNANTMELLSLSKSIIDFKDPCGNGAGYDEILMKTKDNKYVVYFEDGGNRFLSVLENGSYRTTDQSKCYFTLNNGVISNEHY